MFAILFPHAAPNGKENKRPAVTSVTKRQHKASQARKPLAKRQCQENTKSKKPSKIPKVAPTGKILRVSELSHMTLN